MTTMTEIFEQFSTISTGIVREIATWGGYDISNTEIERILTRATTAEEFDAIWQNENWWTDEVNEVQA